MRGQSMGSSLIVALKNRVNGLDFSILGHSCLWKVFSEKQQGDGAAHSSRWRPPGGDRAFDNAIPAKLAHSNSDRQHACLMQRILSGAQRSILEEALKGGHSHSFAGCAKYD